MSAVLLKIYGLLIVVTALFSGAFLYNQNFSSNQTEQLTPIVLEKNKTENSNIVIPVSTSSLTNSTTSQNKVRDNSATTTNTSSIFVATKKQKPSKVYTITQITEIDTAEIDTRDNYKKINPCVSTIKYKLGDFDSKFNISKKQFLEIVNESVLMWNDAVGKKLFEYDDTGSIDSLSINLIYDERQRLTDYSKLMGAEIENTKNAALSMQVQYEDLKIIFEQRKNEYVQKVDIFNTEQKKYNDTVTSWNEKGGAPQNEYNTLVLEKERLQKESEALTITRDSLTVMLADINAKITKHNEFVAYANEKVDINNSTANKKFTEGNYSPSTNKISIYQFTDETKLRRVLAHEFGHALGIDHLKNKQSIMYAVNSATTTYLDNEDIQAVKDICSHN